MTVGKTVFVVTDIETTLKHRVAFDIAWKAVDRKGNCYGKGSYLIKEAFALDVPFFKEKLGEYFTDTYARKLEPVSMDDIRYKYNFFLENLISQGFNPVFCAYNAGFDAKYLSETCNKLIGKNFLTKKIPLLDIWHYWALSVPKSYTASITESGKFYSTSAESVYKYEFNQPDFVERHIAFYDVEIEAEILNKVLRRKKKMPVVNKPSEFVGGVYRIANERLGIKGDKILPGFVPKSEEKSNPVL